MGHTYAIEMRSSCLALKHALLPCPLTVSPLSCVVHAIKSAKDYVIINFYKPRNVLQSTCSCIPLAEVAFDKLPSAYMQCRCVHVPS